MFGRLNYSICHTGSSLTFGGPSTFVLTSGVYNSGGETITFGAGSTNSYEIGAASNHNAFYLGGGSTTTLADATGSSSVFQMVGNLVQGGGSCIDSAGRDKSRHQWQRVAVGRP